MNSTITAIDRIAEIKSRRERAFYVARITTSAPVTRKSLATEVVKDRHVLGMREDETTQKAVKAAETRLASIAARDTEEKLAKKTRRTATSALPMETDTINHECLDATSTKAIADALISTADEGSQVERKMKAKIKIKAPKVSKSALLISEGHNMQLD